MSITLKNLAAASAAALLVNFLTLAILATASAQTPPAVEETPESLPNFPGREDTFGYCVGCHSMSVVSRQGLSRPRWDETLNFMTEKHNMPAPDAEMRAVLLGYLEKAFPAKASAQGGGWISPFVPQK